MHDTDNTRLPAGQEIADNAATPAGTTLELDVAKYAALLGDTDLTEAEAAAMLGALWSILKAFVDLGLDVRAVDKDRAFLPQISPAASSAVSSSEPTNTEDHSGKAAAE
jgi:hypothetical protein